jgi:cell division protein FtsI/penicillin-binding protein 2
MSSNSQIRRMWIIAVAMFFVAMIVVIRLFSFQVFNREEYTAGIIKDEPVVEKPKRGVIYDRNGAVLAVDRMEYRVGVSPSLLTNPEELANSLAPVLQLPRYELLNLMESGQRYVVLSGRISSEAADAIKEIPYGNQVQLEEIPRRFYPQDDLMCHVLGFVNFEGQGSAGIEGYYQNQLAGEGSSTMRPISPLREPKITISREGADLVLTIDRTVQYVVERHLKEALADHGAVSGTIIVMDPRTGAVLAMASDPCYSANEFYNIEPELFYNPVVSAVHEPGSVMKLITMAAALDSGVVNPQSTYQDNGVIYIGGIPHVNWDRAAHGTVDMTTLLSRSLNVGAATIATWMGPTVYYDYLQRFGFGKPTNVDLFSEEPGLMPLPGSALWHESFIGTNAYGQGLAVTPLQMTASVSALANKGYLMQPYLVQEIHDENGVYRHEPYPYSQPIKPETAQVLTAMAITAVNQEVPEARVNGYTIAGKTGTAQIAEPFGYHPTDVIGSFIGWLPAESPEIIVFVKLDRPKSAPWGSMTAAPVYSKLVKELVVLLDIPPDEIRLQADIVAARNSNE